MSEKFFIFIGFIGTMLIETIAIFVPDNPNVIIPSFTTITCDKPLWLCVVILSCTLYYFLLYLVYDKVYKKNQF